MSLLPTSSSSSSSSSLTLSLLTILFTIVARHLLEGQRIGVAEGEGLKAQLLENLNRYSGGKGEGPMEPIGGANGENGTESNATPVPELFPGALHRSFVFDNLPPSVPLGSADRHYQQASTAIPPLLHSFPITAHQSTDLDTKKTKGDKWSRTADLVGEWRRRMYKKFKKQGTRQDKASRGLKQTEQEQRGPLLVFGTPSLIDSRKANKLARLFGVESSGARNGTEGGRRGGEGSGGGGGGRTKLEDRRRHLHSAELKTSVAGLENGDGGDKKGQKAHPLATAPGPAPSAADDPLTVLALPPAPSPPLPLTPVSALPVPSGPLPLHFPSLLPPLPPLITLLPPAATPFPPLRPQTSANQSPEGDYLRELENVPEDYVDEQERRLPCLSIRPFSPTKQRSSTACKRMDKLGVKGGSGGIFYDEEDTINNLMWEENRDMCNSARLRTLIKQTIVPSNVEKSKRMLQQSAEQQFGILYNVVCGTGFFSYIAHTDEFCLVAVQNLNCYVFSPVCSSQLSLTSGIVRRKAKRRRESRRMLAINSRRSN